MLIRGPTCVFLQLVGCENRIVDLFSPTLEECTRMGVFTQNQALTYIGTKIRLPRRMYTTASRKAKEEVMCLHTTALCRIFTLI